MTYDIQNVTEAQIKRCKLWTLLVEDPNDCPRVYAFSSFNKAMKKAYELVQEQKEMFESDNPDEEEFFQYHGSQSSPFKYSFRTCKELITSILLNEPFYSMSWSESFHDYSSYSIEIEGHDGKL